MNYRRSRGYIFLLTILVLVSLPLAAVSAQETELKETFDDPQLPGWEHSEGASVADGVLSLPPENFAVRFSGTGGTGYSFEFKRAGTGVIVFRYAIGDGGEYALILHDDAIVLERAQDGAPSRLGESPWEGPSGEWQKIEITLGPDLHQVSLDGSPLISSEEPEFLHGGGIGFWAEGDSEVEIDNLITSGASAPEPSGAELEQPGEVGELPAPTPEPAADRLTLNDLLKELSSTQSNPTQLGTFLVNLGLSVVLSYILSRVYVHWGSSLSNRRRFAANFILIAVTTTFIILVVRSSVALSLGLVGALSIVRFRSAIKEPEELAYLFFAIAIGIGLGDNQRLVTVIALAVAILVLGGMRLFRGRQADFNLHLTVSSETPAKVELETILETLKPHCAQIKLMRFDDSGQAVESSFLVEFRDMEHLKAAKAALRALSESLTITFLDNKGIW